MGKLATYPMGPNPTAEEQSPRVPLVANNRSLAWVTQRICGVVEGPYALWWLALFALASVLAVVGVSCIAYLISTGVGVWGLNHPVGWAWDITNFVFWIGIGHAGTLISAVFFLTRQKWCSSIARTAEAMTLFAVCCAGIFPAVHVGRVWMVWFLLPVPNANAIWPNFRSPLLWDVFALNSYLMVSALLWYMGLIPDLATMRDRARGTIARFGYGLVALGWRGGQRQWKHYEMAYLVLAGISTALVISVCGIVSTDFATSVIPGWHATIFPLYFLTGAVYSGFGLLLLLIIPLRKIYGLKDLITDEHIDKMCKILLINVCCLTYIYFMEFFAAAYGANPYEQWVFLRNRLSDPLIISHLCHIPVAPYWWGQWAMLVLNVFIPILLCFKKMRYNRKAIFVIGALVTVGMWCERFVIIVVSIHRDFLPSSWSMFYPTWVDIWTFIGSFGIFTSLFLLFVRFVPMISMVEVKLTMPEADPHYQPPVAKTLAGSTVEASA